MDIKNLPEFAELCQEHGENSQFKNALDFAERFSDRYETALGWQIPDHQPLQAMDEAFTSTTLQTEAVTNETVVLAAEVLSRFWKEGSAFKQWFKGKVVLITQD